MKRFVNLIVLFIIITAGWTGAWLFASAKIRELVKKEFSALADNPQNLSCSSIDIAGFPFRFDITCTSLTIHDFDRTMNLPELKLTALVYQPTHLLAFARGPARMTDSFTGARKELRWNSLEVSLRTNGWALARFSLQAEGLAFMDTLGGETRIATADLMEIHLLDEESAYDEKNNLARIAIAARLDGLSLSDFDLQEARSTLEARLNQMPDDLRLWQPEIISANWYRSGTGLELVRFEGSDALSSFSVTGNLTTTPQNLLTGNFDFFSKNISDRLEKNLSPTVRQVAFGAKSEDGQNYQSYELVHGVVLAGNVPVATIPPMR